MSTPSLFPTDSDGFDETFVVWATGLRLDYSRREKWAQAIGVYGSSLWPTATVSSGPQLKGSSPTPRHSTLPGLAKSFQSSWPTIRASDGEKGGPGSKDGSGTPHLANVAVEFSESMWPTADLVNRKSRRALTASKENGRRSGGGQSSPPGLEQVALLVSGVWPEELPPIEELPPATAAMVKELWMEPVPRSVENDDLWRTAAHVDGEGGTIEERPGEDMTRMEHYRLRDQSVKVSRSILQDQSRSTNGDTSSDSTQLSLPQSMWQTATAAAEAPNLGSNIKNGEKSLLAQAQQTQGGDPKLRLNPRFVEWLMGWPSGWTSYEYSETESILYRRRMRSCLFMLIWLSSTRPRMRFRNE